LISTAAKGAGSGKERERVQVQVRVWQWRRDYQKNKQITKSSTIERTMRSGKCLFWKVASANNHFLNFAAKDNPKQLWTINGRLSWVYSGTTQGYSWTM
jgi:hypothetical protein